MRTALLVSIVILFPAPLLAAGDQDVLNAAMEAFTAGKPKECLGLLEGIAKGGALRPKADYLAGEAWLLAGDPAEAEKAFRAVLAAKPDAVPALTGLGRALLARDLTADAVTTLEKAVEAAPKDVGAQRALGEALAKAGKTKEAVATLGKAWKLDKKDQLTARALVTVLVQEGSLKKAMPVAKAIVKAHRNAPMGYFLVGLVLDREKKTDEAEKAYQMALERDDNFIDAHKNLAILYHSVNPTYRDIERTKLAMHHYERYFELGGKDEELKKVYLQTRGFLEQMGVVGK